MLAFSDDFNRPDSVNSLGSADWTHLSANGWVYPSLLSNEAQGTLQAYEVVCLHTTPADTAEQYAEADIWNGSGECGLTICADINATSWATGYHLHVPYWYDHAILRRDGVEVVHLPRFHSTEDAFARYRIELVGNEVRAYENNVLLGTWTDPAPLTGSYVGITLGYNTGNGRVDNFEGGDLVPPEPLYFADDFNRADSADFGPNWIELADGDGEIVNNEAIILAGSGESCLAWATPAATAAQFSQHLVTADWANNTARGPFIFSDLSSDTAGYMISWRASDNRWRIWRNQTAVHTVNSGPDIVAGDIIRIESEPDGSSLIVRTFHNGNLVNEYTDSTPLIGQYVGFNLRTDQIAADDWSGGDVEAVGPGPATFDGSVAVVTVAGVPAALDVAAAPPVDFDGSVAVVTVTGVTAALEAAEVALGAAVGVVTVTGVPAALTAGAASFTGSVGTVLVAGADASLVAAPLAISGAVGSVEVLGVGGTLTTESSALDGTVGLVGVAGVAGALELGRVLDGATATVAVVGVSAALSVEGAGFDGSIGVVTVASVAAALTVATEFTGSTGTVVVAGVSAALVTGDAHLDGAVGVVVAVGVPASFTQAVVMPGSVGVVTVGGPGSSFDVTAALAAAIGLVNVIGVAAVLTGGAAAVTVTGPLTLTVVDVERTLVPLPGAARRTLGP